MKRTTVATLVMFARLSIAAFMALVLMAACESPTALTDNSDPAERCYLRTANGKKMYVDFAQPCASRSISLSGSIQRQEHTQ